MNEKVLKSFHETGSRAPDLKHWKLTNRSIYFRAAFKPLAIFAATAGGKDFTTLGAENAL